MELLEIETSSGLQHISLDKPRLTIGRLPGNDIVLPYAQISRYHAEVRQRDQDWWIIDLGSTNGLHVHGRVIKEHLLHGGDSVVLAPAIILHFISQRVRVDRTVEGTLELPSVPKPVSVMPVEAPPARPLSALAAESAMPLPRRKLGMTPPPISQGARPTPAPFVAPADPAPLTDNALDAWLRDEQIEAPLFTENQPEQPPAPPQKAAKRGDLPLSSPFALMRRADAPASAAKKPLLAVCPTCGERTAPDSPYCWSCRQTIAQPCRVCQLYLLPIQATCSRCGTSNAHAIKR